MKKITTVTLLLLAAIILIIYYNVSKESMPPLEPKPVPLMTTIDKEKSIHSEPVISSTKTLSKSSHITKGKTFKTVKPSSEDMPIYETISLEEAELEFKSRKNITPVAAIRINNHNIGTLQPNDPLLLPDIDGIDYLIHITNVNKNSDGSMTTTGSYSDEGIKYTTTITQSQKVSFINLSTAQGSYEIETQNGIGYIYKTESIRKQMQNTNLNDMIVLPTPTKKMPIKSP